MGLDCKALASLMDNRIEGDRALVGLLIGDSRPVRRPPESRRTVHLLLSDELGQPVRQTFDRTSGELNLLLRGPVQDVQVALADEGDLVPVPGELRVELRA